MRNIYQERMVLKSCKSREEREDFGDHLYHERKEMERELEQADKIAGLMDRFYDELREPKVVP